MEATSAPPLAPLNQPSRLKTIGYIYTDNNLNYYEVDKDLPKYSGASGRKLNGDQRL